jgi:prepilin-type N-terminal cleavage/methylation domain-containing protein
MKLFPHKDSVRKRTGMTLLECLVYIAVFAILMGVGTAAFYFCWDHTRATISTATEVESALRAGETWRADVRAATGKIIVSEAADGEVIEIPGHAGKVIYRYRGDELYRENGDTGRSRLVLEKVVHSTMQTEARAGVTAWRWELELKPPRQMPNFPVRFTFLSASPES